MADKFQRQTPLDDRIQYGIIYILRILALTAFIWAIFNGSAEGIINSIFGVVLVFLPELIEKRYKVRLPVEYDLTIVAFIYGSIVLGGVRDYYTRYPWWDIMLHTTSGVMLGFAGFLILYILQRSGQLKTSAFWVGFFALSFAVTLGVVWEVYEFTIDSILGTNMQPSLLDTMRDLIVDTLGALFSVMLGLHFLKHGSNLGFFSRMIQNFFEHNPDINK